MTPGSGKKGPQVVQVSAGEVGEQRLSELTVFAPPQSLLRSQSADSPTHCTSPTWILIGISAGDERGPFRQRINRTCGTNLAAIDERTRVMSKSCARTRIAKLRAYGPPSGVRRAPTTRSKKPRMVNGFLSVAQPRTPTSSAIPCTSFGHVRLPSRVKPGYGRLPGPRASRTIAVAS
jgi:hypothetical protein